jgi:hypothetical protein
LGGGAHLRDAVIATEEGARAGGVDGDGGGAEAVSAVGDHGGEPGGVEGGEEVVGEAGEDGAEEGLRVARLRYGVSRIEKVRDGECFRDERTG